jgi:lipopolysaccharide transport system ATP-binding protein
MMTSQPKHDSDAVSSKKDIVLSVQGVSKKFCRSLKRSMFYGLQDITAELSGLRQTNETLRKEEFWALRDVNLQLRRGEAVGLVGANGSGKTTLLRMISGLIKPDTGSIWVKGRVAPLIALGAGFSPILTGKENIYANMSILGLSTQEIDEQFERVVEFAEIGDAIDAPVQSYSSGMAARLGFACAIHTNPDILLIDEVLAVGDARFRAKCERRLSELLSQGTSFVLVSHFFQGILNICQTAIYLSNGKLIASGNAREILDQYEQDLFSVKLDQHKLI